MFSASISLRRGILMKSGISPEEEDENEAV
jgi:hypothetical protein